MTKNNFGAALVAAAATLGAGSNLVVIG